MTDLPPVMCNTLVFLTLQYSVSLTDSISFKISCAKWIIFFKINK